jgi:predicted ATP-grasp superfamily ATP-dependent carboligase
VTRSRNIGPRSPLAVVLSSDAVGLGAVRSLQLGRVPTVVLMMDPWEPVRASRHGHKILVPKTADPDAAILEILDGIERGVGIGESKPVLLPTSDHLTYFVSKHRARLEAHFRCAIPPDAAIQTVLDKARDTKLLQGAGVGIPLPRTVQDLPSSPADLIRELDLPLIIKPRTFVDKENLGWRNVIIRSLADAETFYRESRARFGSVIAQELIPGPDDALWEFIGLFNARHEISRAFTFQKLSTMPAHYGATARGISKHSETLIAMSAQVGKLLNYVGIADIDVKYDARDGQFKYLELNPRLGLCHYFGTRCGINLTLDAYRLACGESLPEGGPQVNDRKFVAVLEEMGARLQSGDSFFAVLRGLIAALAVWPLPTGPYFAGNDVLPGPFAVARVGYRLATKAWRGQLGTVFTKQYEQGM